MHDLMGAFGARLWLTAPYDELVPEFLNLTLIGVVLLLKGLDPVLKGVDLI